MLSLGAKKNKLFFFLCFFFETNSDEYANKISSPQLRREKKKWGKVGINRKGYLSLDSEALSGFLSPLRVAGLCPGANLTTRPGREFSTSIPLSVQNPSHSAGTADHTVLQTREKLLVVTNHPQQLTYTPPLASFYILMATVRNHLFYSYRFLGGCSLSLSLSPFFMLLLFSSLTQLPTLLIQASRSFFLSLRDLIIFAHFSNKIAVASKQPSSPGCYFCYL